MRTLVTLAVLSTARVSCRYRVVPLHGLTYRLTAPSSGGIGRAMVRRLASAVTVTVIGASVPPSIPSASVKVTATLY
ncbi:hypothetical protein D3C81_1844210 [compost metagenome]